MSEFNITSLCKSIDEIGVARTRAKFGLTMNIWYNKILPKYPELRKYNKEKIDIPSAPVDIRNSGIVEVQTSRVSNIRNSEDLEVQTSDIDEEPSPKPKKSILKVPKKAVQFQTVPNVSHDSSAQTEEIKRKPLEWSDTQVHVSIPAEHRKKLDLISQTVAMRKMKKALLDKKIEYPEKATREVIEKLYNDMLAQEEEESDKE